MITRAQEANWDAEEEGGVFLHAIDLGGYLVGEGLWEFFQKIFISSESRLRCFFDVQFRIV